MKDIFYTFGRRPCGICFALSSFEPAISTAGSPISQYQNVCHRKPKNSKSPILKVKVAHFSNSGNIKNFFAFCRLRGGILLHFQIIFEPYENILVRAGFLCWLPDMRMRSSISFQRNKSRMFFVEEGGFQSKKSLQKMTVSEGTLATRVIQVTNVAPNATTDQMRILFGFLGEIEDLKLFPE